MRKLIFQVMVSLDGYMEGPDGELDWHQVDEEFNDYSVSLLHQVDTIIFGRKTFQLMSDYWQSTHAIENDPVVAGHMNSLNKVVCSRTLSSTHWNNTEIWDKDVVSGLWDMKQRSGKDIALLGSCDLARTLIPEQLIDEYRIITSPTILGKGKPLFVGYDKRFSLQHDKTWIFNSGKVLNYYKMQ